MTAEIPMRPASGPPVDESPRSPPETSPTAEAASGYVDLGALVLDGVETTPAGTRVVSEHEHTAPQEEFTTVLSRFRASLNRNLAPGDARSHHDLGMAYRTMGLGLEAIGEFQRAVREDPGSPGAYEMLGRCFLDAGQPDLAANSLATALELPDRTEQESLGIYYYLGRAHEASGDLGAALGFYTKTIALDIDFRDVAARYRSLGEAAAEQNQALEDQAGSDPSGAGSPPPGRRA